MYAVDLLNSLVGTFIGGEQVKDKRKRIERGRRARSIESEGHCAKKSSPVGSWNSCLLTLGDMSVTSKVGLPEEGATRLG